MASEYEYRFAEYEYRFAEYAYRFAEHEYRFAEQEDERLEIGSPRRKNRTRTRGG